MAYFMLGTNYVRYQLCYVPIMLGNNSNLFGHQGDIFREFIKYKGQYVHCLLQVLFVVALLTLTRDMP